jgi:O-antigen/teichoic acid export membrane protein
VTEEGAGAPRRALGPGAAMAGVSQAAVTVGGALTSIVIARLLGASGTGTFNLALSALLIMGAFANLGIPNGVSYYVGNRTWRPGDALRQVQLAAIVLGCLGAAAALAIAVLDPGGGFRGVSHGDLAIAVAALPFMLSWTLTSFLAVSLDHYEVYAIGSAGQALITLVLVAILVPLAGVTGAVAAIAAGNVAVAIGLLVWGRRHVPAPSPGWLQTSWRDLARATSFGIKSYLTNALSFLNQRADLLVLNAVAATATVGHYSVALSVTSIMFLLPRALSTVLLPRIAALDTGATDTERDAVTVKGVRHSVLASLATGVAIAGGCFAIPLVFGQEFKPAVVLSLILLPGSAALGVANVMWAAVTGKGHPEYALYAMAIITPATVAMFLVLIPAIGATGAALASTVSYAATAAAGLYYFRRATGIADLPRLLPGRAEIHDYLALTRRWST